MLSIATFLHENKSLKLICFPIFTYGDLIVHCADIKYGCSVVFKLLDEK